ncbi:MAG: hypothetical protein OHK0029_10700 [Armatimonadaceae bacterium]
MRNGRNGLQICRVVSVVVFGVGVLLAPTLANAQERVPLARTSTSAAQARAVEPNADDRLRRAVYLSQVGDLTRAVDELTLALDSRPDWADALRFRAETYLAIARAAERIGSISEALAQSDDTRNMATLLARRGFAYYNRGDYPRAIADYDAALRLQPDWTGLLVGRGLAHAANGNPYQAAADFQRVQHTGSSSRL